MSISQQPDQSAGNVPWPARRHFIAALTGVLLIAATAAVAYWPALGGGFIWDDELLVSNNDLIKAPNGPYLFWCTTYAADYWPITNTSFWLEWRLWGTHSAGYHVTNLALHIASALLIWMILRNLAIPGAFLAALLFAVHPVNVESVAWIAQRKNTLAMVFFLLSILWYLRAEEARGARGEGRGNAEQEPRDAGGFGLWYWLSFVAFVLAMLSKGSVAVLPAVLLLIVGWQRRRIGVFDVARVIPFLLVAATLTAVNIWFQTHHAAEALHLGFANRLLGAGAVVWFYLSKALAPIELIFVYPKWNVRSADLLWWLPFLAVLVFTRVLLWQSNRRTANWIRALLFAWAFFCLGLLPVLGFVDVGFMQYSLVADHYQYLALIGVVALAAAAWSTWHDRVRSALRPTTLAVAIVAVAMLTLLSRQQSALYADAITLYQATLRNNPECWVAYNNLGVQFANSGRPQEAQQQFEQALQLKPNYAQAHYNLGNNLATVGERATAIDHYEQALRCDPHYAEAHNNLGSLLVRSGRFAEAIEHYHLALQNRPNYAEASNNLGVALASSNHMAEAIGQFQQALQADPNNADAHYNLGMALLDSARFDEAAEQFQETLRLQPDRLQTYPKLTTTYAQLQQSAKAIATAEKALELARSSGQTELAEQIANWLKSYRSQQEHNRDGAPAFQSFP